MKISIIIPTFNRSKYLDYTLKTCLNQNYDNVEFIIHDDCSIDEILIIIFDKFLTPFYDCLHLLAPSF